jgi:hypothetical protein
MFGPLMDLEMDVQMKLPTAENVVAVYCASRNLFHGESDDEAGDEDEEHEEDEDDELPEDEDEDDDEDDESAMKMAMFDEEARLQSWAQQTKDALFGPNPVALPIATLPAMRLLTEEAPRFLRLDELELDWEVARKTRTTFMNLPFRLLGDNEVTEDDHDVMEGDDEMSPKTKLMMQHWFVAELYMKGLVEVIIPEEKVEEANFDIIDEGEIVEETLEDEDDEEDQETEVGDESMLQDEDEEEDEDEVDEEIIFEEEDEDEEEVEEPIVVPQVNNRKRNRQTPPKPQQKPQQKKRRV